MNDGLRSDAIDIGEVAERTGVAVSTLHVWERDGLVVPIGRRGLRRQYDPQIFWRIALIQMGQATGFTNAEIAELLDPGSWDHDKTAVVAKLDELRQRRQALDTAIATLEHAVECDHPEPLECPVFAASVEAYVAPTPTGEARSTDDDGRSGS